ncbi:MAG: hypothetical protein V4659_09525 [Pseudomonadota bacterium]
MAANVILVEAAPRQGSDGAAVTVRLAGGGAVKPYRYDGQHWRAGINGMPRSVASLDFDGEQLGGGGVAQAFALRWGPATNAALAELASYYWGDAPITVRIGPEGDELPPIATAGLVLDAASAGGELKIALADQVTGLKRALLVDRYAGTGDLEGPADWSGLIKPRAWGRCFNVAGRCIDTAYNIWVFGDPARPWQAFDKVRDVGVDAAALTVLAWQGSIAATLAALRAAVVPAGGGVVCPSLAAVRWWTQPAGDLRADIRGETAGGYVETAPEIVARIVASSSTVPFAAGAVAAAAVARPMPFGWRVESDSATIAGEISEMLGGVSLSWTMLDGKIEFRSWTWGASVRSARSQAVVRREMMKPVARRRLGYRRNWAPMARGDLAAIVLAADVVYGDGTPVEDLQPAAPGATRVIEGADIGVENAADVTGSVTGPAQIRVAFDYLGNVLGAPLPREQPYKLFKGGVDRTTDAAWSRAVLSGSAATTMGSTGGLGYSTLPNRTVARVSAALDGKTYSLDVEFVRDEQPAPSSGGGGSGGGTGGGTTATDNTLDQVSSTTHAVISDELEVTVGAIGKATISLSADFETSAEAPAGFHTVYAIAQRWNGSSFVDIGTETICDPIASTVHDFETGYYYPNPGHVALSYEFTGLTSGTSERFRIKARRSGGSRVLYFTGTAAAVGE